MEEWRCKQHRIVWRSANWTDDDERAAQKAADELTASTGTVHGFWRPLFGCFIVWFLQYECSKCGHMFGPDFRQKTCPCCGTPMVELEDKPFKELAKEPKITPLSANLKQWRMTTRFKPVTAPPVPQTSH